MSFLAQKFYQRICFCRANHIYYESTRHAVNPNARAVAGVRTVTATIEDGAAAKLLRLFFF
jgi:hypothetical protein